MSEATEAIPFQITLPELLGDPGGLYVRELPAGNLMLSASYAPGPDLPEAAETGVGLLLMQFTSSSGAPSLIKGVTEDYSTLAEVEINGQPGFWVEGASQLTIVSDPSVGWEESVTRPSANVLLWQENGVTYRMESALSLLDAVQIAESMQPVE